MIELTDNEKYLIRNGQQYLKDNDIKRFYQWLSQGRADENEKGHISTFFLENGINVLEYFTSVPNYMFYGADIESIDIPDNITRIGKYAFKNCEKLQNVNLGNSLKSIETEAFSGCTSLRRIFLPDSLTILGQNIFNKCSGGLVIMANKRTPANRLRCKQNETPWYRKHLFVNDENAEGENI